MPPHKGHLYLIDFASSFAESLTVVVGSLASEPIPGELRLAWMRELFPRLEIVHLTDENPQLPDQHPDFWSIWKASLERVCPRQIDLLFASESYGERLADTLGARFIPTNGMRELYPISGSQIRERPLNHWEYLPRNVRPHFTKTVVVFGPESTGKTTLSRRLAQELDAAWVPEYARTFLSGRENDFDLWDMEQIARGQQASMKAACRFGKPLVISDTDALTTLLWCEELFGRVPESVESLCRQDHSDLTLLLKPDVAWVDDTLRLRPDTRERFFQRCREVLDEAGRDYLIIGGDWPERERTARAAVDDLLG